MLKLFIFVIFILILKNVEAENKCVWVRGAVRCLKDPSKQMNVDVRVYDRDGWSIFKMIDPDDLMGVTFTERDGTISLDGCGADFDWLPGVSNPPDPYIIIRHSCNGVANEILELPEFNTFVPDSYDLGIIELDSDLKHNKKTYSDHSSKKDFPKSVETKHNRLLKSKEVTSTLGVDLWNSIEDFDLKEMDVTTKDSIQNKEEYKITNSDADLFPSFDQPDVIKLKNINKK